MGSQEKANKPHFRTKKVQKEYSVMSSAKSALRRLKHLRDIHSAEIPCSLKAKKTNETIMAMLTLSEKAVAKRLISFWNL